jgi:hypothetical protein
VKTGTGVWVWEVGMKTDKNIIVALIGLGGVVIAAIIGYFAAVEPERMKITATQTAEAKLTFVALSTTQATQVPTILAPSVTTVYKQSASNTPAGILSTVTPSAMTTRVPAVSPTQTLQPTLTNTPSLMLPIEEVFPQIGEGEEFYFINNDKPDALRWRFQPACRHSGLHGIEITYRFAGEGNGGWGIRWDLSNKKHFDASSFDTLTFWVKGMLGVEKFQLGLKDKMGNEYKIESDALVINMRDWSFVSAPLSRFRGVNTQFIDNVNLGFNPTHGSGTICLDDIAFVKR